MPYRQVAPEVHLFFEDEGSGRALVLLHGLWASGRAFADLRDRLRDRYRIVVPDLRAHGRSSHVQHGHTVATYAADLQRLIDPLVLGKPVLVGWSLGAQVAWQYARQFGAGRLAGIVAVGQAAMPRRGDRATLLRRIEDLQVRRAEWIQEIVPSAAMREDALRIPTSIAAAIFLDHGLQDYRRDLERGEPPTLLCLGRRDPHASIPAMRRRLRRASGARIQVFEASGARPFEDEPEMFARTITDFMESTKR